MTPRSKMAPRAAIAPVLDADADRLAYGQDLAARGAVFAAAGEFRTVLTSVAGRHDGEAGTRRSIEALAAAFLALDEADDFYRIRSSLDARRDVSNAILSHETEVLKDASVSDLTPLHALQAYHAFARERFKLAGGNDASAADALYGLARLEPGLASHTRPGQEIAVGARVTTLLQAALSIDPTHHEAANELGVVLARYGRLEQAAELFKQALQVHQTPETWHNFATVLEQLGNESAAARARDYSERTRQAHGGVIAAGANVSLPTIRWVEPAEFATAAPHGPQELTRPTQTVTPTAQTSAEATERPAPATKSGGFLRFLRQRFSAKNQNTSPK